MINKSQVRKNFGQNAATYDQYAVVQQEMAQDLLARMKATGQSFRNILEIGCGTGLLTKLIAVEYPEALITATDIAPEMLNVAQKKLADYSNIEYLVADGENLLTDANTYFNNRSFDLIISNAVFQWFTDYAAVFVQYYTLLVPSGYLMFSTLGSGTFKELYACLQDIHHSKNEPFIEKKSLQKIMRYVGFYPSGMEEVVKQEYFDSCRNFLKAVKMIGAHSSLTKGLANRGLGSGVFSLIKTYDAMFLGERGVPVTYQCLYGWGQR